jgi:hypothetical protein
MIPVNMRRFALLTLLFTALSILSLPLFGEGREGSAGKSVKDGGAGETVVFAPMAGPGKRVSMGNGYYLIYGFDKTPKLGTVIMKVEIFTKEGKKDTSFDLKGDAGMPSMRGAHETGDKAFALSKKGDYLLPVNIVMPGDWEIRLTVAKDGKVIMRGRTNFDV